MDDATRESFSQAVLGVESVCLAHGLERHAAMLRKLYAFLRSDRCPRAGDVLLRPLKPDEWMERNEECVVGDPFGGFFRGHPPTDCPGPNGNAGVYRRIDCTESEGV